MARVPNRIEIFGVFVLTMLAGSAAQASTARTVEFNRDIRPILSNKCFQCHGPDEKTRKGGRRLDTAEGAFADIDGVVAIVKGKPEQSELIKRVTSKDDEDHMPPSKTGKKIELAELETLRLWIQQGAPYAKHWSYEKPQRPPLPPAQEKRWPRNGVDHFILARLEKEKLKPSPETDRFTLARRAALDLTGLPPTIEEVDAFIADKAPDAYEKFVDRMLAKPAYGEHWARMWLDLARYADSAGYADDPPRTIWAFRDYVIKSFNANKPFDQFTVEQIAGDLLPNATEEQIIATAFHRNTMTNSEGGTNDEEFRNAAVVDRVNTTMAVWMATSMACAQCHTHKFDPISQKEYFQFFAFLNNTEDADRNDETPRLDVFSREKKSQRENLTAQIAQVEQKLKTPTPELQASQAKWEAAAPLNLSWSALKPSAAEAKGAVKPTIQDDGAISAPPGSGALSVTLPITAAKLSAVRIETLGGAKAGETPAVLSRITASVHPPAAARAQGRFVRVELPGDNRYLHLAEVQVFSGSENLAIKGEARQINTDFGGDARRANDGNTDGDYNKNSVSHTAASKDPWWEVDLKSAQPVDRIVVWNRTDGQTEDRMKNWRVLLLDEKRQTVWEKKEDPAPKPSKAFDTGGARSVPFTVALADHTQDGYDASTVLLEQPRKGSKHGWSSGGRAAALTLVTAQPVEVPAGSKLVVSVDQPAKQAASLHFRVSVTDDARAAEQARMPADVVEALKIPADKRSAEQKAKVANYYLADVATELAADRKQLAKLKGELAAVKPDTVPIYRELAGEKRRKTRIQIRGNFLNLDEEVTEGVPAAFQPLPQGEKPGRLALARWLVDENNPLTARVIANRFWEQLFGTGLVRSSEEFGSQGEMPSHPELLDWLAVELAGNGRQDAGAPRWDIKSFLKLLVTSAAYRQSSRVSPELQERDPENRLLARGPRFRSGAEVVRDQALALSGLLSPKMFGPSVRPPRPSFGLNAAFGGGLDWQPSAGQDRYRRGLYTEWRRTSPYPSMVTFDAPNREVCTLRRVRTNTPLQALVTLNDPVYVEAAQSLARRIIKDGGASTADKARFGLRLCLLRPAQEKEIQRLTALHEEARAIYAKDAAAAKEMATTPLGALPAGMEATDAAAWTTVANVLLNLDETLMKP